MSRTTRFLGIAAALIAIIFIVTLVVTLSSPTPAPLPRSIDYLKIVRSLSAIQSRVEAQKAGGSDTFTDLREDERQKIREASDGLVRQVNLRPDGAIAIHAVIAPKGQGTSSSSASVNLLLVPEKLGDKYDWHCFGNPISALPTFCEKLP